MSVFICWSGPRSHKIADEVKKLLKAALPKLPLTYALCALVELHPEREAHNDRVQEAVRSAVSMVENELGLALESETAGPIKRLLTALESGHAPSARFAMN